jgi:hypothetical protein
METLHTSETSVYFNETINPTTHLWRRREERRYSSYSFMTSALDGGE